MSESAPKKRRRRYEAGEPRYGVTPNKALLLAHIAECGMLTRDQCVAVSGVSQKAAYNWLRDLIDARFLRRFAVPKLMMLPKGEADQYAALAPSQGFHVPTKAGIDFLAELDMVGPETAAKKPMAYGPANYMKAPHEELAAWAWVWLKLCERTDGGKLELWLRGAEAAVPPVNPDALFAYRLEGGGMRIGLVEADNGTMDRVQFERKIPRYAEMFASGRLAEVTNGRRNGKVVVLARDAKRRDELAGWVAKAPFAADCYVADRNDLSAGGMARLVWRRPLSMAFEPFIAQV